MVNARAVRILLEYIFVLNICGQVMKKFCRFLFELFVFFVRTGLNIGKKLSTHWVTLNKNEKQNVDYYQCIVHDDRGQIGYKSTPTKLVIKEQLEGSASGSGSGGK